ncbi:MAG: macro domain-containing protein [Paracoccaceae bacterium]
MKKVTGDLLQLALDGRFDAIVHGCNCMCTMGAGIAVPIKQHFPEAFEADQATQRGEKSKLGTISTALIVREGAQFHVINAYTQYEYGRGKRHADYEAIRGCFRSIAKEFSDARIGYPLIGAGLAGGDWTIIEQIIEESLSGMDHTLVELPR